MVSTSKLVPPNSKEVETPVSSWPDNLAIKYPSAASIIYPDADTAHVKFDFTHVDAVPSSHMIVPIWEAIASKTILKLQKMALDWAAVECFECKGKRANVPSSETTLIITLYAMPPITLSLATLLVEIYDIAGCRIEMRAGDVGRRTTAGARKYLNQGYLLPGSRISFSEGLKAPVEGTVGGIVELRDSSGVHRDTCVLTCRSFLPSHESTPSPSIDIESGTPRHPVQNYGIIRCAYPSEATWQDCFEEVNDELKCVNRQIKEIEEEMKTRQEQMTRRSDSLKTYLSNLKSQAAQRNKFLDHIASVDCSIGAVYAVSGNRVIQNPHLDWALVSLDEDTRARLGDANTTPGIMPLSHTRIQSPNRRESLKPGLTVFKARYPEYSGGIVNATKSYLRLREGDEGDKTIETIEWAIVPQLGYKDFGERGDCGVWIVSRISCNLVGVVYAMNPATGASYVTPIGEIFEDITKDTGYSVQLPGALSA